MQNSYNEARLQIIYDILKSLNRGNSGEPSQRVDMAIEQYEMLVKRKIIKPQ